MADDELSSSLQESIITALCYGGKSAAALKTMVDISHFEEPYRDIAARIITYRNDYGEPPGLGHIDDLFDDILGDRSHKKYQTTQRILVGMRELSDHLNIRYVTERCRDFVRRQSLKAAMIEAGERFQQQDDKLIEDVESILGNALKAQIGKIDAGTRFSNLSRVFQFLETDDSDFCFTGIPQLDRYGIYPRKGEMLLFIAPKGRGKCLDGNSLVLLPNGQRKRIEDVVKDKDKYILAINERWGKIEKAQVSEWHHNGIQPCWEVVTVTGKRLACTIKHPLLTEKGWTELRDLNIDDFICTPLHLAGLGKEQEYFERLRLLGYLIADGCLSRSTELSLTKEDQIIRNDFEQCVTFMGDCVTWNERCGYIVTGKRNPSLKTNSIKWINELGLLKTKSKHKFIPEFIFTSDNMGIAEFLKALFSCDGSIYKGKDGKEKTQWVIEYSSSNYEVVKSIQHLLIRFGIVSKIKRFTAKLNGKEFPDYGKLLIKNKKDIISYIVNIGFVGQKAFLAEDALDHCQNGEFFMFPLHCRKYKIGLDLGTYHPNQRFSSDLMYERIKEINYVGERETFDLTIPGNHNFIVNDVVSHNSWMCHYLGKKALQQNWKVLHVSLENYENVANPRYLQTFFAVGKRDEQFVRAGFDLDERGYLDSLHLIEGRPKLILNSNITEKLTPKIQMFPMFNNLIVKDFPSGSLTVNKFESYLEYLESVENFMPDLVLLDYPDLMWVDQRNYRLSLGRVFVDLRGLAKRRNFALVVPTQGNRESQKSSKVFGFQVSEDISKTFTSDIVLTYSQTAEEHKMGLARLFVNNSRNDIDRITVLISQAYAIGQFKLGSTMFKDGYFDLVSAVASQVKEPEDKDRGQRVNSDDED